MTVHLTRTGSETLCGSKSAVSIHEHYAVQAITQGLTEGKICEGCINATHNYRDSDHCLSCGAEIFESPAYYLPCTKDFE